MARKRKYELKARAEAQEDTRRRITEATVGLHLEVGPAQTTISEVAKRAGVQRLTGYNNFPDELSLLGACPAHYPAPPPPPPPPPVEPPPPLDPPPPPFLRGRAAVSEKPREAVAVRCLKASVPCALAT